MTWENSAITIATFLPIVGAIVIALMPKSSRPIRTTSRFVATRRDQAASFR